MFTVMAPMMSISIENFAIRFRRKKISEFVSLYFFNVLAWDLLFFQNGLAKKIIAANYNETKLS
jgi:hypothetical protein